MSLPAGLTTALSAVTEVLDQHLRQLENGDVSLKERTHAEDLAVALEELKVVSEELDSQMRNVNRERERSAFLFDAAPYAFLVLDFAGHILEANRAAVAFLGVLPQRLSGKPLVSFVADAQRGELREKLAALRMAGEDAWLEWDAAITPRDAPHVHAKLHLRIMPYAARGGRIFCIMRLKDSP